MLRFSTTFRRSLPGLFAALMMIGSASLFAADPWVVYQGVQGPGLGKHIVLVTGDEEYRSEEALTQLAQILAKHHGFKCTVLFAIDPETGTINPNRNDNIPGLEKLADADLMIQFIRWRNLPDEQLKHFDSYFKSGKPMIGIRTGTHPFRLLNPESKYKRFSYDSKEEGWDGGVGRQIFGETWISHHGKHNYQATRGIIAPGQENHPIAKGIAPGSIFGPTDVYGVRLPLLGDGEAIVLGQVVEGMNPDDPAAEGEKNNPMMPLAWTRTYSGAPGKSARVFTSTMGSGHDMLSEGYRRMLVNAVYWTLGKENAINPTSSVATVGDFKPNAYGTTPNKDRPATRPPSNSPYQLGYFADSVKPSDLAVEGLTP